MLIQLNLNFDLAKETSISITNTIELELIKVSIIKYDLIYYALLHKILNWINFSIIFIINQIKIIFTYISRSLDWQYNTM